MIRMQINETRWRNGQIYEKGLSLYGIPYGYWLKYNSDGTLIAQMFFL